MSECIWCLENKDCLENKAFANSEQGCPFFEFRDIEEKSAKAEKEFYIKMCLYDFIWICKILGILLLFIVLANLIK